MAEGQNNLQMACLPTTSNTQSKDEEQEILDTLREMYKLVYTTEMKKVYKKVKGKDIVLFVGNTKCGKSTIVNHLIGNPLTANSKGKKIRIIKQDPNNSGPDIGARSPSQTTVPSAWLTSIISSTIVDAPGFDDNRGDAQDVANSFYISVIIDNARSVKFALISDVADIAGDNIKPFTSFIDKILTMLPHDGHIHKGIVMVFTKDRDDHTKEDIGDMFKEKIIDEPDLQIKNRQLVDYLYNNLNHVTITTMPKSTGLIAGTDVFGTLIDTIEQSAMSISKSEMSTIVPGISDKSKAFLLEAHRYFTELKELDDVLNLAHNEFVKGLVEYDISSNSVPSDELITLKQKLKALEDHVKSIERTVLENASLFENLAQLKLLVPEVEQLNENSEFYQKMKFVTFIDSILKTKESTSFSIKIQATVSRMLNEISCTSVRFAEKTNEISFDEAKKMMEEKADSYMKKCDECNELLKELTKENEKVIEEERASLGLFQKLGTGVDIAKDAIIDGMGKGIQKVVKGTANLIREMKQNK